MTITELAERPSNVPADRVVDFDVYNPEGVENGFHEIFQKLRDQTGHSLVWTPRNEGHWIATGGQLMLDIWPDHKRFSSRIIVIPKSVGEQHQMLPSTIDPPFHRDFRNLLNVTLSSSAIKAKEPLMREMAGELIDKFMRKGHCNFTTSYAELLPIQVFLGIVDLPQSDARLLKKLADDIVHPDGTVDYADAKQGFFDYLEPHLEQRRNGGANDMLSIFVNGTVAGRPLTKEECLILSMQALMAGLDTVVNMLGFAFEFLAQNPGHVQKLRADPSLIPAAVNELIRRFPVVNVAREVRMDIECDGVDLKQGDVVMLVSSLVGTDENLNKCPFDVDFQRTGAQHATFGKGVHFCPGTQLAITELRITLEEWLKRIPEFSLAADAGITYRSGIVGTVDRLPLIWPVAA
ncbi:MAG: cytochrome [Sphingomonadales bacterium]|nr:cytochrome [Sphingomonadales bacterium]